MRRDSEVSHPKILEVIAKGTTYFSIHFDLIRVGLAAGAAPVYVGPRDAIVDAKADGHQIDESSAPIEWFVHRHHASRPWEAATI